MTRQVLNRGTIANDGTGDTLRTASLKIEQNFQEIYNKLGDGNVLMPLIDFDSSGIIFEGTTADAFETRLSVVNPTADRAVTIPNYSGSLVMDSATQTLENKTLTSPVLTTPQINDSGEDYQYLIAVNALSADRTITLPLLTGDDEITFNDHTQTLTNKTLQAPQINNPQMGAFIFDSAGNELIQFQDSASAVNFLRIANSTTGEPITLQAAGEANSSIEIRGTGNGAVRINSRLRMKTQGLGSAGTVDGGSPVTVFTNASTATHTLADGSSSENGEIKYLVNTGSQTQTINATSGNIAGYSTITLDQNEAATLLWFENQWVVISTIGTSILS